MSVQKHPYIRVKDLVSCLFSSTVGGAGITREMELDRDRLKIDLRRFREKRGGEREREG